MQSLHPCTGVLIRTQGAGSTTQQLQHMQVQQQQYKTSDLAYLLLVGVIRWVSEPVQGETNTPGFLPAQIPTLNALHPCGDEQESRCTVLLVTMGDELHRLMPLHPFMLTATIWVSTPWLAVPLCRCSVCVSQ